MMLLVILQELRQDNIIFAVSPLKSLCEYPFYSRLGIHPKLSLRYKGIQWGILGKYIPKRLRNLYGLVTEEEVDVILDSSGFAYSDVWGVDPARITAYESKRWKKQGKRIIFMPQAFGPFNDPNLRKYMKCIVNCADLLYARDELSYRTLLDLENNTSKIKVKPDFTGLLDGVVPEHLEIDDSAVCIVPNTMVINKGKTPERYLPLMVKIVELLRESSLEPFFLIFGGAEDRRLAQQINASLAKPARIMEENEPVKIKGIIESCLALIGSRFHALASSLYSGKVTLGIGWSHKYSYLFKDFGFEEGLIDPTVPEFELRHILTYVVEENKRQDLQLKLRLKANDIKSESRQLFKEIRSFVGFPG
ncbi:MAG: polysaccharide pyruvyl transferase family protein [Deltaproteobacteria bacterium]|nr:polysaccharide pyruvyl transferase family protein [Deltaproteobacteria bacterium]